MSATTAPGVYHVASWAAAAAATATADECYVTLHTARRNLASNFICKRPTVTFHVLFV